MIDVSPLTHLAQHQPVPVDSPQPLRAISPVESAKGAESGKARDSGEHTRREAFEGNVIYGADASVKFRIDRDAKELVVSILDSEDNVIRQVPSEVVLRITERIEALQARGNGSFDARV